MRTRKPPKQKPPQRETVLFDRTPSKEKFQLDLDCVIGTASEHGLSSADIVEQLLLRAEQTAVLATERGEDLSRLNVLLFGEEDAQ
jgi:hypothetical protein